MSVLEVYRLCMLVVLFLCCLKGCHSPGARGPSMGPYPIHNIRSQVVDQEEVSRCAWRGGEGYCACCAAWYGIQDKLCKQLISSPILLPFPLKGCMKFCCSVLNGLQNRNQNTLHFPPVSTLLTTTYEAHFFN